MLNTASFTRGGSHVSKVNVLPKKNTKQPSCLHFADRVLSNKYIILQVNEYISLGSM